LLTIQRSNTPPAIFNHAISNKIVAPKAKTILNINAPATPIAIILFLFYLAKLAASIPMIMALSAAITISIRIICIVIMNCSNIVKIILYILIVIE
jgi:hypothetical protein